MAFGLIVYDASGNITVDITDRLTRHYGSFTISLGGNQSTFISLSGMTNNPSWVFICNNDSFSFSAGSGGFTVKNTYFQSSSGTLEVYKI